MGLLDGKTALVTGAARGIGKAIALKFASEGARVAIMDLQGDDTSEETLREIEEAGHAAGTAGRVCAFFAGDVAETADADSVVASVLDIFGGIDILVNNAGINSDGLMLRMSEEQWNRVINVNLKGAFNFIRAVLPVMTRQRSGSIINMSSVVGESGNAGQANYAASKAGLIGLAKSVAKEMGPRGIRANCIAPGFIISDMTHKMNEEKIKEWEALIPLHRGGTVEEVAKVALFLASDLSSYVSGQVINCCGALNT